MLKSNSWKYRSGSKNAGLGEKYKGTIIQIITEAVTEPNLAQLACAQQSQSTDSGSR